MSLKNFFLPHPDTHKKAHLLSFKALFIYVAFFIVLQFIFSTINSYRPGTLGVSSSLDYKQVIELTNKEREKNGLSSLSEDSRLNEAAKKKAENMFEENYWAHYSPSGKDPWGFINGAGYKYSYAGENLARNFYSNDEVVQAWMDSPTHRKNILNSQYRDIGIAVVEGTLNGQKTILVVQEFGTPTEAVAMLPEASNTSTALNGSPDSNFLGEEDSQNNFTPTVSGMKIIKDPYWITKVLGFGLFIALFGLICIDFIVLRKRAVMRLSSRHLPHLALLSVAASTLFNTSVGSVL